MCSQVEIHRITWDVETIQARVSSSIRGPEKESKKNKDPSLIIAVPLAVVSLSAVVICGPDLPSDLPSERQE